VWDKFAREQSLARFGGLLLSHSVFCFCRPAVGAEEVRENIVSSICGSGRLRTSFFCGLALPFLCRCGRGACVYACTRSCWFGSLGVRATWWAARWCSNSISSRLLPFCRPRTCAPAAGALTVLENTSICLRPFRNVLTPAAHVSCNWPRERKRVREKGNPSARALERTKFVLLSLPVCKKIQKMLYQLWDVFGGIFEYAWVCTDIL